MAKKDEDKDKLPTDATSTGMVGEPDEYGVTESREAEGDLAASTQKLTEQQGRERRGVFKGLKSLSRRGALTPEKLEEARTRASAAGVSGSSLNGPVQAATRPVPRGRRPAAMAAGLWRWRRSLAKH